MPINLPYELTHKILLDAAQSSTSSCRILCKVSTWVRHLALPLLYNTIPIHAIESITETRPVCPPSPTFNPARAVRNIWAPGTNSNHQWWYVAQQCTRMSHLAVGNEDFVELIHVMMRLQSAGTPLETGDLHVLILQTRNKPMFIRDPDDDEDPEVEQTDFVCRITHLRLEDPIPPGMDMHIHSMDRLTHLAVSCGDGDKDEWMQIYKVVTVDTSVQVFVVVLSLDHTTEDKCREAEDWVYEMREGENNDVYVVRPLFDDLEREWDAEVRSGVTIWKRAVEHTQQLMDRMHSRIDLTMSVNLPRELLHKIFLYAAESSSSSCRTLCEVSTWVRRLSLPLLYTTVSIDHNSLGNFCDSIISGRATCPPTPAFRPADAVRNLCVFVDSKLFEFIIRCCNNVIHLATVQPNLIRLNDFILQNRNEGRRGTSDLQVLLLDNFMDDNGLLFRFPRSLGHPLFERITHLQLEDPLELDAQWPSVEMQLKCMPRLTHFAMPWGETTETDRQGAFDVVENTSVEVFVLVLMPLYLNAKARRAVEDWVCRSRKTEPRIYVVNQLYHKVQLEWEVGVKGGATVWKRAVDYTQGLMSRA